MSIESTANQNTPEINDGFQGDAEAVGQDVNVSSSDAGQENVEGSFSGQNMVADGGPVDETAQDAGDKGESGDDWEQKYKILQGKYNKEIPRLNKELKRVRREKEDLIRRIEMLEYIVKNSQAANSSLNAPQQEVEKQASVEEDEEIKKLKEEFPEIYTAVSKLLNSKFNQVESKVSEVKSTLAEQSFYDRLSMEVPDWQELNSDPDFLDWLQEEDATTGFTRHQLLLMAYEKQNAPAVARFFKAFKQQQTSSVSSEPPVEKKAPAAQDVNPPRRATSVSTPSPSKKVWKESEIKSFYKKAALGELSPQKIKEIEADIAKAALENRIIYNK